MYRTNKTKHLDRMLRKAVFVWNNALALQKRCYRLYGKYISTNSMQKHFVNRISRTLLHSPTAQEILQRLDAAYRRFFKRQARGRRSSERYKNEGLQLHERTWTGPECGIVHKRDYLVANNILRQGIAELKSVSKPKNTVGESSQARLHPRISSFKGESMSRKRLHTHKNK